MTDISDLKLDRLVVELRFNRPIDEDDDPAMFPAFKARDQTGNTIGTFRVVNIEHAEPGVVRFDVDIADVAFPWQAQADDDDVSELLG